VEAVKKISSKYVVMVKDDEGNLSPQQIEVGIVNESYVEVLSGLLEGDTIYYNEIVSEDGEDAGIMMPGMMMDGGDRPERPSDGGGKNQ